MSGAPQPALDFVEDQHRGVRIGSGAGSLKKFCRAGADSALALNGLQHDGAHRSIHRIAQRGSIIEWHKFHRAQQRLESFAIFFLPGHGESAESPAVERPFHCDHVSLAFCDATCSARQLKRALHSLGAAVGEKYPGHARELTQFFCQAPLILVVKQI